MNNMDFFDVIGYIDEKYILEAKRYKSSRKSIRNIFFTGGIAACFALCLFLGRSLIFEMANTPHHEVTEKDSLVDNFNSKQNSNSEAATSNEIMDNLNQHFSVHDFPDWFGDYYLEQNIVYVSLVELNEDNKSQVQAWAKSQNITFKKAEFSYNYLNSVFNSISHSIECKQITFISNIWIDSKSNRIKVNVNYKIKDKEMKILYSYDEKWNGGVFDVNYR